MVAPAHYALELPQRLKKLLNDLLPHAKNTFLHSQNDQGPLASTFILALATPMIIFPIERILRQNPNPSYANDAILNRDAAEMLSSTLNNKQLHETSFFKKNAWSMCSSDDLTINIAHGLPASICGTLNSRSATEKAANMNTSQWCSILRNALAHGGVAYLSDNGENATHQETKMFCFVSSKRNESGRIGTHFLRISQNDFLEFLDAWCDWLDKIGIQQILDAA